MIYIFDKKDLSIKQATKISEYNINLDEECSGKSTFKIIKQVDVIKGDLCYYKNDYFLIDSVEDVKGEKMIVLTCVDLVYLFDRKVIEQNIDDMMSKSLEQFIGETLVSNFVQTSDPVMNINYINVSVLTQTKTKESTNSENLIYNFKTFIVNCRQNKNIFMNFEIVQGNTNTLKINIKNTSLDNVLVDTTVNEVTNYNKVYEVEPIVKVDCICRDTLAIKHLYLKSDFTTTTNINDPLRINGLVSSISVDKEENADNEMLNVFKGNRYNHYVEFKIKKSSKLVDTSKLIIGTPIKIKTYGIKEKYDIYDSYISAISYNDEGFIYYKSGKLRVTLTDKLSQNNKHALGNKLDITGGTLTGNIVIDNDDTSGGSVVTKDIGAIAHMSVKNGFLGIDCTGNFLRTPAGGLIPNKPEGLSGYGVVGTPGYRFYAGHFVNFNISDFLETNELYIKGTTALYITTGNGWYAFRFSNNVVIQLKFITGTASFKAWGGIYSCDLDDTTTYPISFVEPPLRLVTHRGDSASNWWGSAFSGNFNFNTTFGTFGIMRGGAANPFTVNIALCAIGRWR